MSKDIIMTRRTEPSWRPVEYQGEPISNADHIRGLTDNKELCRFLRYKVPDMDNTYEAELLAWLNSTYESGDAT